jgi:hypothetical protein
VKLPISRTALGALGDRLSRAAQPEDSDLDLLEQVLEIYGAVMIEEQDRIAGLGYDAVGRTKTTGVLIDKLRRSGQSGSLKTVQDLAGLRIVMASGEGRVEQNAIAAAITATAVAAGHTVREVDRRANPSHGYRALHLVITTADKIPVEVQVRTNHQHVWAQLVETLGDWWGRGIRYGESLPSPDTLFGEQDGEIITRRMFWDQVQGLGDGLATLEEAELTVQAARATVTAAEESLRETALRIAPAMAFMEQLTDLLKQHRPAPDDLP